MFCFHAAFKRLHFIGYKPLKNFLYLFQSLASAAKIVADYKRKTRGQILFLVGKPWAWDNKN